jgi:thiol-disulfide isomerase/thioredoxin
MKLSRLLGAAELPNEGRLGSFEGATGWLNSEPLTTEGLRGRVVLVDFWTYTCINWLRTLSYIRAWAEAYEGHGFVVIGVHTPEFPFEQDADNVREAATAMGVEYPVALDSDYAIWRAFDNQYWPAAYVADAEGRIRHHRFGEGGYEELEQVIQRLLGEAGRGGVGDQLVAVAADGFEAQADWENLGSPETYLGYEQAENFASPGGVSPGETRDYATPDRLTLNHWSLAGDWTVEGRAAVLNQEGGRISFRFHARDVHLVMGPRERGTSVPFRVLVDGDPPGTAHGLDVGEDGRGTVSQQRLYQLIRQQGTIGDRTVEITFLDPGVEAYAFTFG